MRGGERHTGETLVKALTFRLLLVFAILAMPSHIVSILDAFYSHCYHEKDTLSIAREIIARVT